MSIKNGKIEIRFSAYDYGRIQEISSAYGADLSTIVRAGMTRFLDDAFNQEGFLNTNEKTKADKSKEPF